MYIRRCPDLTFTFQCIFCCTNLSLDPITTHFTLQKKTINAHYIIPKLNYIYLILQITQIKFPPQLKCDVFDATFKQKLQDIIFQPHQCLTPKCDCYLSSYCLWPRRICGKIFQVADETSRCCYGGRSFEAWSFVRRTRIQRSYAARR